MCAEREREKFHILKPQIADNYDGNPENVLAVVRHNEHVQCSTRVRHESSGRFKSAKILTLEISFFESARNVAHKISNVIMNFMVEIIFFRCCLLHSERELLLVVSVDDARSRLLR